jgi:membrane associated rhomboid family serine protease
MLPIRDHNPSGRVPYVTYALIAANVLIFLGYSGFLNDPASLNRLYFNWAMIPARVSSGDGFHTVISSMFLHGGWMHLLGNMLFLYIYGDNIEDEMGHLGFAVFYVAAGLGAGAIHVLSAPYSTVPTVGASGAIAGVMGGYLLLFPKARVDILIFFVVFVRILPIPAWIVLMVWFGMQLVGGVGADPTMRGVAYWAHLGGFAAGLALTIPTWLRLGGPGFWRRTDGHPPHPEARYRMVRSNIPKAGRRRRN